MGEANLKLFMPKTFYREGHFPKVSVLIVMMLHVLYNQILLQLVWHHDFLRYHHEADGALHPVGVLNKAQIDIIVRIFP